MCHHRFLQFLLTRMHLCRRIMHESWQEWRRKSGANWQWIAPKDRPIWVRMPECMNVYILYKPYKMCSVKRPTQSCSGLLCLQLTGRTMDVLLRCAHENAHHFASCTDPKAALQDAKEWPTTQKEADWYNFGRAQVLTILMLYVFST